MIVGAGNEGDPAMSELHQVAYRERGAMLVVNLQAEQSRCAQLPARNDNGYFLRVAAQLGVSQPARENNDPVHPATNEFPHAAVFVLVRPIAAHEERRVAAMAQASLDPSKSFTVERAVNRLRDDTDGQCLAERETAGGRVRPEIKLGDGGIDGMLQAVADVHRAVDDPRNGAGGDAGLAGHHSQGRGFAGRRAALAPGP